MKKQELEDLLRAAREAGSPMAMVFTREALARDLWTYGEDELAARVPDLSDEEMRQIRDLALQHAMSDEGATKSGKGILLAKAATLAAIEVLEGQRREPKWKRRRLKGIYPGY
jgi:hypothetical protein